MATHSATASPGFLDLPAGLRQRIYVEAGLEVSCGVHLPLNRKDGSCHVEGGAGRPRSPDLSLSCALMLTCRAIHAETSLLFYSTNRFVIRFLRPGDLRQLYIFRPELLRALTCLILQLNISRAVSRHDRHAPINCPMSSDGLLDTSPSAEPLLSEWEAVADHLGRHIQPNVLDMGLICDVADAETAQRVTAPLSRLPILAGCHVRLGPGSKLNSSNLLKKIAREAGQKAEGRAVESSSTGFLPFSRFPSELRLRILMYTDLVAPLKQVSWNFGRGHDRGYALPWTRPCETKACKPPYDTNSGRGHYTCQFRKCWKHQGFCFCQRHHTSYSSLCRCWEPPSPLFLVSRTFHRDACAVFFGENHFNVQVSAKTAHYLILQTPRPTRYPESIFLTDVVPAGTLHHIRSLEFSFLQYDEWPALDPPEHRDWLCTIDSLTRNRGFGAIFPSLVLRIGALEIVGFDKSIWEHRFSRGQVNAAKSDAAINTVKDLVATFWPPLVQQGSLHTQGLFAFVESESMEAGYYLYPTFRARSSLEPPGFAERRGAADLNVESTTEAVTTTGLIPDQWVEGIWAIYKREDY